MKTRSALGALAALALSLSAFGATAPKPNILFLLSDDHSYPFLSCYGDTNVRTPSIDRLAAEGMKFHRFFTVAPQCVPSRAGYMTGRSAVAVRITRFSSPLPRDEIIFPEVLRSEGGYYTGVCSRGYHLDGSGVSREIAQRLGLVTFKERLDSVDTTPPDQVPVAVRVAEFLDHRPSDRPFFLWANFSDPHYGWNAKSDEPDPATLKVPGYLPDTPSMRRQLAAYCGEVNRLDRQVKDILDGLAKRGLLESTLIIFAGDNGLAFPHGKGSLHDPGLNVPFIVRWPGVVQPGTESRELISAEDFGPTLLAAAGLKTPARMTGVSFLPLLRGEKHTPRRYIFGERGSHGQSAAVSVDVHSGTFDLARCVRSDRYKFIYNCTPWVTYNPVDSSREAAWQDMVKANEQGTLAPEFRRAYFTTPRPVYELYDLENDPAEMNNLAGDPKLADVEQELRTALAEKMVFDFDYLPLPAMAAASGGSEPSAATAKKGRSTKKK